MPVVNSPFNVNAVADWTDQILEQDNQYGFILSQGIFDERPTTQTSIIFDRVENEIVLIPQADRKAFSSSYGKDRKVEQFALVLPYFKHRDYITVQDIQDKRQPGQPDVAQTLAVAKAEKILDLRLAADQTREWLQFSAMTGETVDADGNTIANMYTLFGLNKAADYTVDLETQIATTDLDKKIATIKRKITTGLKNGSSIQGVDFWLDYALFDEIIAHPKFREVYNMYQNSGKQMLRDELTNYYAWGVTDMFEHRGVRFLAYNPEFAVQDSDGVVQSKTVLGAGKGIAVPRGARGLFRGYNGPSNKLSGANRGGAAMFAYEYPSQDDTSISMEVEMSPLYFCTKPAAIIHLS